MVIIKIIVNNLLHLVLLLNVNNPLALVEEHKSFPMRYPSLTITAEISNCSYILILFVDLSLCRMVIPDKWHKNM